MIPAIIEDPRLTEQFRFPKSKKKRIRKKWAARPGNHRPSQHIYIAAIGGYGKTIVCHPAVAARLKNQAPEVFTPNTAQRRIPWASAPAPASRFPDFDRSRREPDFHTPETNRFKYLHLLDRGQWRQASPYLIHNIMA